MDDYFSKPYYDQNATRQSADAQLGASYRGAFIVRPSSQPGQLALSVYDGKVRFLEQKKKKILFFEKFLIYFFFCKGCCAHGHHQTRVAVDGTNRVREQRVFCISIEFTC
jgi:hypothetical protein